MITKEKLGNMLMGISIGIIVAGGLAVILDAMLFGHLGILQRIVGEEIVPRSRVIAAGIATWIGMTFTLGLYLKMK